MDYVYLYCGCCVSDTVEKAKVVKIKFKFTGYENFYEMILTYVDKASVRKTKEIDLAYVWSNKNNKTQTIGELLELEHDPCIRLGNVKWN